MPDGDSTTLTVLPGPVAQPQDAPRDARPGRLLPRLAVSLGVVVASMGVGILLWELVILVFGVQPYTLPAPAPVAAELVDAFGYLWQALATTLEETLLGFLIAVLAGVVLAAAIAASRLVERLVYPLLAVMNAVPKIALAPVFLAWFGLGSVPRVVMAALLAIFPIVISTVVGLVGIDAGLIMVARSAQAGRLATFRIVRLPAALPSIFGGLKVGITLALTGAVVGELVGGNTGLGYVITFSQGNLQLPLAFAAIALLALAGVVLFYLLELTEKAVTRR
ncbi:MAG TPA: ABC transporter permease [Trebonia sp.]|nr:ABC transporter permease [Trebonia sp.]